jgi:hypothetical protein
MDNSILLKESLNDSFERFFDMVNGASLGIDKDTLRDDAMGTIKSIRNKDIQQYHLQKALEKKWYKSLGKNKEPDYSVYADNYYLSELFACWIIYSRQYLLNMASEKSLPAKGGIFKDIGRINNVVDLGCGIGFTTAALSEMFPNANIIGTNIKGIPQTKIALTLSQQYNFGISYNVDNIDAPIDILFASEYFEHIQNPIDHLFRVITRLNPRVVLIANSFSANAIGHFNEYCVAGEWVDNKRMGRIFNSEMRLHGYEKVKTKLWNDRPSYWRLFYES